MRKCSVVIPILVTVFQTLDATNHSRFPHDQSLFRFTLQKAYISQPEAVIITDTYNSNRKNLGSMRERRKYARRTDLANSDNASRDSDSLSNYASRKHQSVICYGL
jgi:hypothetical protein